MKRKLYRIYTENVNVQNVEQILNKYLDGYTMITGEGIWKGKVEDSLIIEIVSATANDIMLTAAEIKELNQQESVLVTCQDVDAKFV